LKQRKPERGVARGKMKKKTGNADISFPGEAYVQSTLRGRWKSKRASGPKKERE